MPKKNKAGAAEIAADKQAADLRSAMESLPESLAGLCGAYAGFVLVPRILAARRRAAGDPNASPRDYECHCDIKEDGLPLCDGVRDPCKFSARRRPPGPRYHDDRLRHDLRKQEMLRIFFALPVDDPRALFAEIARLRDEVDKAFDRIEAASGRKMVRAMTRWPL